MVTAVRVCHILFGYILTSILGYNEELRTYSASEVCGEGLSLSI